MNGRQSLIAQAQAAELMQPGDGSLDDPARLTQATAVLGTTLGDQTVNALGFQMAANRFGVIAAVDLNAAGFAHGSPVLAGDRRDAFDQGQQLRDIVAIGFCQDDVDREPLHIDEEVVLAVRLAAIGWVRSSFFPPCAARTEELSATTRLKSSLSAPRSSLNSTRCRR